MRPLCLVLGIVMLLVTVAANPAEKPTSEDRGWAFTHAPLFRSSADSSPVAVITVTGDLKLGGITQVELRQQRGPQPRSIRLGWYLRVGDTIEKVLRDSRVLHHGQTVDVVVRDLRPDVPYPLNIIVVDYQEVRRLLRDEKKPGVVFIGVAVDQVDFADGSKWVREGKAG